MTLDGKIVRKTKIRRRLLSYELKDETIKVARLYKYNELQYRSYYYDSDLLMYDLGSRFYDPVLGRFLNADDVDTLSTDCQNLIQYNLYAYCWNNPVNMCDDTGTWPGWVTKVAIGTAAIAIGIAATALTGGAAIPVLAASIKIAITSAVIGASVGAGTSAVSHRISTGSWSGVGKAAFQGAVDGAADGFMWGGISAGVTFATTALKGIKIQEIGKLKANGKKGDGYMGVKYENKRGSVRSLELHSPHKGGPHQIWHWQRNVWNPKTNTISSKKAIHWTLWGKRI